MIQDLKNKLITMFTFLLDVEFFFIKKILLIKLLFCTAILTLCWGFLGAQNFQFTENKGQWHPDVRYKGELSVGAFFLTGNGYRVVQHHSEDFAQAVEHFTGQHHGDGIHQNKLSTALVKDPTSESGGQKSWGKEGPAVRSHAYEVIFEGANPQSQILPERPLPGYANYFLGNDPSKWASNVNSYGAIRYANIYPGIDVRFYAENGYLKYDFIVYPGADPGKLVLRYDGATLSRQNNGELFVKTSVSEVKERVPYTYQLQKNGDRKEIGCQYVVAGNRVQFGLDNYNRNESLIIDPTLVFSTFTGSTSDNWGYTATYDAAGNAYGGGIVFGNGFPTTLGAFQRFFNGGGNTGEGSGFDMGLMKLSPNGSERIFSTYLGGSGNEQPHSLVVDDVGNLIVSGRTTSVNYPATSKIGSQGNWDIVVTKFNPAGSALIGSVQIGGDNNDGVNIKHKTTSPTGPSGLSQNYGDDSRSEVLTDRDGNIYVASCTRSNNFPATPGVVQSVLRGNQDAVLLKFNPSMALTFATLLGGVGDDAAYVLFIEDDNNILVAGGTASNDFPGDKSGTVASNYGGGIADGFIARVNATGTAILKSVYIGTSGSDQVYGMQKDRNGFVYVMGTSTGNFGIRNATFGQDGGKQFIAKLQPDFSAYVYSTVFGPPTTFPNISPTAFFVDRNENVYVSGWGGQLGGTFPYPNSLTNNLPVTADALYPTTDGKDFYFFVLERNAVSQLYGSFFGQQSPPNSGTPDHVDGGTSRFDPKGVLYQAICANCSPGQFPTTPGVVAPNKPAGATCNLAIVKIAFNLTGVAGGIKSTIDGVDGDTNACAPTIVNFRDTIAIAQTYQWNFGDGSSEVTTAVPQISHPYSMEGNYRVRLIAIDLNARKTHDTSFVNISVRADRVTVNATATKPDTSKSNSYLFDNLSSVIPGKPANDTSYTWIFGDNSAPLKAGQNSVTHQYATAGTYNVLLILRDTNYCNAPDTFSFQLSVKPLDEALLCPGGSTNLPAMVTGNSYIWQILNAQVWEPMEPNVHFTGTQTAELTISNLPLSYYGTRLRCVADGNNIGGEYIIRFGSLWTAATNEKWNVATNWSCGAVPTIETDAIIPGGVTPFPVVDSPGAEARRVILRTGAQINILPGMKLTIGQ